MRINFDFTDLEVFLAVRETGSFHVAAERLGLSQSSVSRRIQKLEDALDSQLFERTTREVKPTFAGKRLQVRAEAILAETLETTRSLRDESIAYQHQKVASIAIATIPSMIPGVVTPAMKALNEAFPRARIRLIDASANDVAEAVSQGDADIGISSVPMPEPATNFEFLFEDPIVIACHGTHAFAQVEHLTWEDVLPERLILSSRDTGNRMMINDALAAKSVAVVWTIEVGRTTTALALVAQRLGVAPVPLSALSQVHGGHIVSRPISKPAVARPVGLIHRTTQTAGELATAFAGFARESARRLVLSWDQ